MPVDTSSVSKLRDDLKESQSKFNISSYLTSSEASKYLSELPGLEDIISAVKGLIDTISKFANMILDFIEKILSFLNLNSILDALGLRSLLDFVSKLIGTGLGVVGLSVGARARLNELFNSACMPIGTAVFADGYNRNLLERFALLALILGLSCSLPGLAFTEMYKVMNNTPEVSTIRSDISALQIDLVTATNNQVFVFDEVANDYVVDQVQTDANVSDIQAKIDSLEIRLSEIETQIDNLFASFVPMIFSNADKIEKMQTASILGLTEEIANHEVVGIVRNNNLNLSGSVLNAIDKVVVANSDIVGEKALGGFDVTVKNNVLYNMFENKFCPSIPTSHSIANDANTLTAIMKELPQEITTLQLVDSIKKIDAAVTVQSLNSSVVVKALAMRDLGSDILPSAGVVVSCDNTEIEDITRYLA